jgi:hypothetical protein
LVVDDSSLVSAKQPLLEQRRDAVDMREQDVRRVAGSQEVRDDVLSRARVASVLELLGGLESGLVEMIDDVLRDVLLRGGELNRSERGCRNTGPDNRGIAALLWPVASLTGHEF